MLVQDSHRNDTCGCDLEIGEATWNKPDKHDISVRARFENRAGGFSTGSPEVPVGLTAKLLIVALEHGYEPEPEDRERLLQLLGA